jgi:hypothetical protein
LPSCAKAKKAEARSLSLLSGVHPEIEERSDQKKLVIKDARFAAPSAHPVTLSGPLRPMGGAFCPRNLARAVPGP